MTSYLITGGTGTFGRAMAKHLLSLPDTTKVAIFSRDEQKQDQMRREYPDYRMRWFIGDVRDAQRLYRAFDGIDVVIHAAAMKIIDSCTYNPGEAVKTNVLGALNVVDAAIDRGVSRVVALSTDKACEPTTLYGATKACLEKIIVNASSYAGSHRTTFSCVRYGNVAGSRGSVIPLWRAAKPGDITITDERMTRYWMFAEEAVKIVDHAIRSERHGCVWVPVLPAFKITDLAIALGHDTWRISGIRKDEKLHESMISAHERWGYDGAYRFISEDGGNLGEPDSSAGRCAGREYALDAAMIRERLPHA